MIACELFRLIPFFPLDRREFYLYLCRLCYRWFSSAPVYIKGEFSKSLSGDKIPEEFMEILEQYVKENFSSK